MGLASFISRKKAIVIGALLLLVAGVGLSVPHLFHARK